MTEPEKLWFDGVDKKLIELHSKKTTLQEGNDKTLKTKEPLASFSCYKSGNRKRKRVDSVNGNCGTSNGYTDHANDNGKNNSNIQNSSANKSINGKKTKEDNKNNQIIKPNTGITDELAMDCEMVECYHNTSVLARVSIVNLFGHPILDRYVAPPAPVTDYRTRWSGIRRRDLLGAPDFDTVQEEVASIIKDRIVVGHALHNDFAVLKIHHPPDKIRDTSLYFKYLFQGKSPSLKKLCECVLGLNIQKGEHCSIQDAQATMKLYVKERDKWNEKLVKQVENQPKHHNHHHHHHNGNQKTKPKKKKIKTFYVLT